LFVKRIGSRFFSFIFSLFSSAPFEIVVQKFTANRPFQHRQKKTDRRKRLTVIGKTAIINCDRKNKPAAIGNGAPSD